MNKHHPMPEEVQALKKRCGDLEADRDELAKRLAELGTEHGRALDALGAIADRLAEAEHRIDAILTRFEGSLTGKSIAAPSAELAPAPEASPQG